MGEREAALALVIADGAGPATARRLRSVCGSYREAVRRIAAGAVPSSVVSRSVASSIARAFAERVWEDELALVGSAGARFAIQGDSDYPRVLSEIPNPPTGLFVRGGRLSDLTPMVAIVGSRRCTPRGRAVAAELAEDLARAGVTVVSGMARGIDTAAHEGALDAGGGTVAVLGCGLGRVYPPENARLADRIAASGALVSEFPTLTEALPGHFPRRNRVIAGLSAGVVVVEAAERSGALITAARALEQDREVFAVPGPVDERASRGPNRLIKAGACLIESAADILDELDPAWGPFGRAAGTPESADGPVAQDEGPAIEGREQQHRRGSEYRPASSLEEVLKSQLSLTPVTTEALISRVGASASEVLAALLRLELSGAAQRVSGHSYVIGARCRKKTSR